MRRLLLALAILCSLTLSLRAAEHPTRGEQVRGDKAEIENDGLWIYNDIDKGVAEAKSSGKPMLVVFR
jgi:hypothetical protein